MKFQNPSFNFFEWTGTRAHARTSRNQNAPHFFKVWGIKIRAVSLPVSGRVKQNIHISGHSKYSLDHKI